MFSYNTCKVKLDLKFSKPDYLVKIPKFTIFFYLIKVQKVIQNDSFIIKKRKMFF